ncbi:hypothetical protein BZM26_24320 [Paraburkholderia strydomiana]|nr:hypothetical protein BZM26_24320 [Paraburkholderia strydomiana]
MLSQTAGKVSATSVAPEGPSMSQLEPDQSKTLTRSRTEMLDRAAACSARSAIRGRDADAAVEGAAATVQCHALPQMPHIPHILDHR